MKTITFQRPDARKLTIEIIQYQSGGADLKKVDHRHRHDFHSIYFIQEGYSLQEVELEEYKLEAPQILIIPKGAMHWEKAEANLKAYIIVFTDDFLFDMQKQLLHSFLQYAIALRKLLIPIPSEKVKHLTYYFELLFKEQEEALNQNQTFLLQNLLLALLNKLESLIQYLPEKNSFINQRKPFQRFIQLVEANYLKQAPLDFYTSHLQLTNKKLNQIIKNHTGQTASNYIIDRVMIEAKRELCFGEKSIKEISNLLGYENPYYFSRIFKKRIGKSPEQFRLEHAE